MKKILSKTLGVAALLGCVAPAMAAVVNVGGVTWDTDHPIDFTARSDTINQFITEVDGYQVLNGYGKITNINNQGESSFCPGCELTFEFGDFVFPADGGPGLTGWVKVYVDNAPDYTPYPGDGSPADPSTANNGALWLSLEAANDLTVDFGEDGATGRGLLNVVGGIASSYFDTNQMPGGADFNFQNSFAAPDYIFGSGNYRGDSVAVPEPGTLALLSLGLVGFAAARRRSNAS